MISPDSLVSRRDLEQFQSGLADWHSRGWTMTPKRCREIDLLIRSTNGIME